MHITRLLQLHKLTQAAGSGFTREELHKLLSCLPSFEEGGEDGGEGGGDGDGGDGGGGDGGDSEQEVDSEMTLLLAREHARASRMRNARRES